jgi:hypothetical protein
MASSADRKQTLRAQPAIEGLEDRQLLSNVSLAHSIADVSAGTGGVFSHHDRKFTFATPSGGIASVQIKGLGNLTGTTLTSDGLKLEFGNTNSYSQIYGTVHGGNGTAPLFSIYNQALLEAGQQNSVSGVGGNVLQAVYLTDFDLVKDGQINLSSGVNTLVLNSVGSNTQIHLRELPPAIQPSALQAAMAAALLASSPSASTLSNSSSSSSSSNSSSSGTGSSSSGTGSSSSSSSKNTIPLQQFGKAFTNTSAQGVTTTYVRTKPGGVMLTAVGGSFTAQQNITEALPAGQPADTPPPAPPGVILKINTIAGDPAGPIDLLTDPVLFGYDPKTGDVVKFTVDLATDKTTGHQTLLTLPNAQFATKPTTVAVNLGTYNDQVVLLVGAGTTVAAYDPNTGAFVAKFATTSPVNAIGTGDQVTLLGSYTTNSSAQGSQQITAVNLQQSLATRTEQNAQGMATATNTAGFTLIGGMSGLPGSNTVTSAVAAFFDTFQPTTPLLGLQPINTVQVDTKSPNPTVSTNLSGGTPSAVQSFGNFTPVTVPPTPSTAPTPSAGLGSIDQSLALLTGFSNGVNNTATLSTGGSLKINYPNQLVALTEAYRPDLVNSALIDIQGDVQSFRGGRATGMVLNDTGNLNLVKFGTITNSTIIGQPVSHLQIGNRSNVSVITPLRTIVNTATYFHDGRNGVTVDKGLQPIGPLSLPSP